MLATLAKELVVGSDWIFEEKYDGIRAIAEKKRERVKLWSRTGQDLTAGFTQVADQLRALPDNDLVLDGELVVFDPEGVSRFQMLQRRGIDPRVRPAYVV
ncbi:MAG: DNA ligase, partial [Chloroflexota bacterium]|nr:DNA ligase [Chloroflexota bacterium]